MGRDVIVYRIVEVDGLQTDTAAITVAEIEFED